MERRPLATRQRSWARRVAAWLAARRAAPNHISIAGMVLGIAAGACLAATAGAHAPWGRAAWIGGAVLVQLRLAANMFDGMVAIAGERASAVGEMYNEVPDRVSDAATLIGLGYAAGGEPALGYVAACAALFVAYVRAMGAAAGAGQDFCGPLAKPQRMFLVTVAALYCGLTPASWQPRQAWGPAALMLLVIIAGSAVTAVRRLLRIARALRSAAP